MDKVIWRDCTSPCPTCLRPSLLAAPVEDLARRSRVDDARSSANSTKGDKCIDINLLVLVEMLDHLAEPVPDVREAEQVNLGWRLESGLSERAEKLERQNPVHVPARDWAWTCSVNRAQRSGCHRSVTASGLPSSVA